MTNLIDCSITFSDLELEENVGGVEEPYVTWTDEEDAVIWEMDFCQCSQHEPDGEEDVQFRLTKECMSLTKKCTNFGLGYK
jgi:hypothetical protein